MIPAKKIVTLFIIILTLSLLVACLPKETENLAKNTVEEPVSEEVEEAGEVIPVQTNLDGEILNLLDKAKQIDNYEYFFDSSVRNEYGSYLDDENYQMYYTVDRIKKVHTTTIKLGENFQYNEVYLSLGEPKAIVTCTSSSLSCEDYFHQGYRINAASEMPKITPLKIVNQIPLSTKKSGEVTFENRKVIIVDYQNEEDNYESVYLDNYYGLPLKRVIYTYELDEKIILRTETFTKLSINGVKIAEVTLPENYEVIN